jgi:transposase
MEATSLPDDITTLHAALAEAQARACAAEAEAAWAVAQVSSAEALIASLKLEIAKLRRELYGPRAERTARLLDQLELHLEELEATASEDELAAEQAASRTTTVKAFTRKAPSRQPFPAHLPRERVVVPAPGICPCCGSDKLSKLGETITETLEVIPRQWKVIQTVREKFACRSCETITQPPAPFHAIPRLGRSQPAGHDPGRQVRSTPALEPAMRALRPGRRRGQPVDAGRSGGHLRCHAEAVAHADRSPCHEGRTPAWR